MQSSNIDAASKIATEGIPGNPVWIALAEAPPGFVERSEGGARYRPEFASLGDAKNFVAESVSQVAAMLQPGQRLSFFAAGKPDLPPGFGIADGLAGQSSLRLKKMGHSQAEKLATHQRIVQVAARRLRERGIDGISVGDIMKEAGLTVGGFYKHFESRDALVTEAFIMALQDIEHIQDALKTAPQQAISTYVSGSHRNNVGRGCPISALVNDVARAPDATREVFTERVSEIINLLAQSFSETEDAQDKAVTIFSTCVGSIALARAVKDPSLSNKIIEGALEQVLKMYE
ncbi:TetR/AcrR family transcriptional regulator [Paraburkholderia dipogonis]|uniref:TetR/AcrR family transcriptional regulator n=1 Tax=Paraburkholderia dipogonis TaxID=1211383 RepID=UPI0038B6BE64